VYDHVHSVNEGQRMERKSEAELLKGIPPRTWVALSADESRVVGTGSSYGEAVDRAGEQGESDPILLMTPPSDGIQVFFR
jgi:hypothetical protein